MNTEKALAVKKNRRTRRQKNKHSKYIIKKTDDKNQSTAEQNENSTEDESENEQMYTKRKIESNWSRYEETGDFVEQDKKVEKRKDSNDRDEYVPIEILSRQEINKQLKVLPDPKPPRSVLGRKRKTDDISADDAAFWFDDLSLDQQEDVKLKYDSKKDAKKIADSLNVDREETVKSQRQPKVLAEKNRLKCEKRQDDKLLEEIKSRETPQPQRPQKNSKKNSTTNVIINQIRNHDERWSTNKLEETNSDNTKVSQEVRNNLVEIRNDKHLSSNCSKFDTTTSIGKNTIIESKERADNRTNRLLSTTLTTRSVDSKQVDKLTFKSSDLKNKVIVTDESKDRFRSISKQNTRELESWLDNVLNE